MALHAYGLHEAALQMYRRAIALDTEDGRWHYLGGIAAEKLGMASEAIAGFEEAARLGGLAPFPELRVAEVKLESGDLDAALALYQEIGRERSDWMAVHFGKGKALAGLGREEEAAAALKRAAALAHDYAPVYYQLGHVLRRLGREEEAVPLLAAYERSGPGSGQAYLDPLLRQVEEFREGSYLHHLNRGRALEASGDLEGARREYMRAVDADAEQVHARVNLIAVHGRLGDADAADAAYRDVTTLSPSVSEAHYNYGVLLLGRAEYGEAESAFRRALAINPYLADARLNLGDALERQGQAGAAIAQFRLALEHRPGHRLALFRLGTALFGAGREAEALRHLRDSIDEEGEQAAQFLVVLARAERKLGLASEAARHAALARRLASERGQARVLELLDSEFPGRH